MTPKNAPAGQISRRKRQKSRGPREKNAYRFFLRLRFAPAENFIVCVTLGRRAARGRAARRPAVTFQDHVKHRRWDGLVVLFTLHIFFYVLTHGRDLATICDIYII
jgi:hypothetical protein